MSSYTDVHKYINTFRVLDSTAAFNVLSQNSPECKGGKWFIPVGAYKDFLNQINKSIETNRDIKLHFLELPCKDFNQIKIDIDLRFPASQEELKDPTRITRRYDETLIIDFVEILSTVIDSIFKNLPTYRIFVQEKQKPRIKDTNIKDGIHIIIPDIVAHNQTLHYLRDQIITNEGIISLLKDIGNKSEITETIDKSIIDKNPWFIYGCGKPDDNGSFYHVTHVFEISKNTKRETLLTTDITEKYKSHSLHDYIYLFSNFEKAINVEYNSCINLDKLQEKYYTEKSTELSRDEKIALVLNHGLNITNIRRMCSVHPNEIHSYLQCIKKSRADDYMDWRRVGLSLYNMDDRNFPIWNNWSKQSEKYCESMCHKVWYLEFPKLGKYKMGLHTIRDLAKTDNPSKFKVVTNMAKKLFFNKWIRAHMNEDYIKSLSINTLSEHIKQYITDYATFKVVCADPSGSPTWYRYDHNCWCEDKAAHSIYMLMTDTLSKEFLEIRESYRNKEMNEILEEDEQHSSRDEITDLIRDTRVDNSSVIEQFEKQKNKNNDKACFDTCNSILAFISSNVANKEKIIKDLSQKCYDIDFYRALNENHNVFICNNCVLDLDTCQIRRGDPADMSTMSCRIDYPIGVEGIESERIVLELQDYLDKIFPDSELQDYFLNKIAEKLSGTNRKEEFHICTGIGGNGKSQIFKLLSKVFGDYYAPFDNSLLNTPKKDANSASPAVASLKGIRIATTSEPKNGLPFETDKLKEYIGGDELTGRHLNKDPIRFIPQYKMFMMCNDIPDMPSTDEGVWRKVFVIPFESKFITKQDELYKLQDKIKFPNHYEGINQEYFYNDWAPYFLKLLFERYKDLKSRDFKYSIPDKIKMATRKYQQDSNIFSQFFTDKVIEAPGFRITQDQAFKEFTAYARESNSDYKCNKKAFTTQMERFIGKPIGRDKYYNNLKINGLGEEYNI